MPWWQQPFFQVALPVIITIFLTTWYLSAQITKVRDRLSKHIDDVRREIDGPLVGS